MNNRILRAGIIGAIVTAICCFTPVLVILSSVLGLTALVGYLDYVLFPLLAMFLVLIAVGIIKKSRCAT